MSNAAAAVSATPDWGMFWTWATGMFMAGIVTTVAGRALFPIVSPQRWGQMQSDASYHAMPLAKSFSEMLPVFAVPTLIWKDLLKLSSDALATPADSLRLKPTSDVCSATGALLGYMAFDCVFMLCYAADVERSNGKAMFYQLWVHHLVSLFVWPLSLHTNVAVLCVSWFLFSEASNFFLTPRTVLKKLKYDEGVLYTCCGLGWLVTFFLTRIVPIPLLVLSIVKGELHGLALGYRLLTYTTVPMPLLLNMYWFYLGIRGLLKFLSGKPKSTGRHDD